MDFEQLAAELPERTFQELMAFEVLEPSLEQRIDRAAALIACKLHNLNRGKGDPALSVEDFMPEYDADPNEDPVARQVRQTLGGGNRK